MTNAKEPSIAQSAFGPTSSDAHSGRLSPDGRIHAYGPEGSGPEGSGPEGSGSEDGGPENDLANGAARGSDRHSIMMLGHLQLAHMPAPQPVRIRNLSQGGLLAETPLPATVEECLTVYLPNIGPVTGRVAWTALNKFGVAFDNVVDPHQVRRKVTVVKEHESELLQLPTAARWGRPGFIR